MSAIFPDDWNQLGGVGAWRGLIINAFEQGAHRLKQEIFNQVLEVAKGDEVEAKCDPKGLDPLAW